MKRAYVRPTMVGERFVANEYVAACGEKHEAESNSGFLTGYHIDDPSTIFKDENIPVTIWTNNDTDVHCTTNLDMKEWETAKS